MERLNAPLSGYDGDFLLWLETQISLLRERRLAQLDLDNLIEELEGFVRNERRELRSRLRVIIMHLLKWEYQPRLRSEGWLTTLGTQRFAIELLLEDSPSLGNAVHPFAQNEYARAVRWAIRETGLPPRAFPAELPYTRERLLDPDFVP